MIRFLPMLKLNFPRVKDFFSTYKKTLLCGNCEREFKQVLRKGHRLAKDTVLSVIYVLVDAWNHPEDPRIYKGVVACPRCGCSSQISVKEPIHVSTEGI